MEMQQLRYVVAVARTGNFSRAAEHCHVSQPSLSQQILKLEDELGERLFERMKRVAKLTPHGEAFLRRAVQILHEVDAAKREAAEAKDSVSGVLVIGVLPTIAPYLLPETIVKFTRINPGVEIVVQEDTTERLLKHTLAYEIDLALVSQPVKDHRLSVRHLLTEELLLALPPGHPLTRRSSINAGDIARERLIVMKAGHCLGDQVLDFCERRDWQPQISFRSAQLETIQALVSAGVGLSLIPAMAARRHGKLLPQYRSLQSPKPQRDIVLVWPKQRALSRCANEFLKMTEAHLVKSRR